MQDTKKEVDKMKNTMKKPVAIPVEKLHHTAAFHDDFCLVGGSHSGHAAKVAQYSILTQRHGAGHSGVGGNDSVLHINRIILVAVTADSLCEYSTLVHPCIVQNDVGKSQADRTRR